VTAEDIHFVQGGSDAILIGSGSEALRCSCGNKLIERFQAGQFLGVGIRCGGCGAVTTTPPLETGGLPPRSLIVAEPSSESRTGAMTVPGHAAVVGRAEMDRLGTLLRPVTPANTTYLVSNDLLDQASATFERHAGAALPDIPGDSSDPFVGLTDHALAWAVRHLRTRLRDESWACLEDAPTANATTHVAGFLHFVATWSHHPLFPTMLTTAADRGLSLHGLALFAAAHCMAMMGNRVGFRAPSGYPRRIDNFDLATGAAETVLVHMEVFDRFEFPLGRPWDAGSLRSAASDVVAAAQGRINLRNPGLLLLSPGTALAGYDEALIEAVKVAVQSLGRKNRGLMAVAPIVLRLLGTPDPHAVQFGYGFFPITNRHYGGDQPARMVG
jgi:hypothetical protein